SKHGVLSAFKRFKASVECETGKKLKCIRTDNGGDYLRKLEAYCRTGLDIRGLRVGMVLLRG
ncbi:hypothetical protein A2U01_0077944, partial [Trifolium medium]|nr:hypothetical protein [Trifolium medium]